MEPLVKKLVQMVKMIIPMVQMLPTNGTIGRTRTHAKCCEQKLRVRLWLCNAG